MVVWYTWCVLCGIVQLVYVLCYIQCVWCGVWSIHNEVELWETEQVLQLYNRRRIVSVLSSPTESAVPQE